MVPNTRDAGGNTYKFQDPTILKRLVWNHTDPIRDFNMLGGLGCPLDGRGRCFYLHCYLLNQSLILLYRFTYESLDTSYQTHRTLTSFQEEPQLR
jgi:hypothetical protein